MGSLWWNSSWICGLSGLCVRPELAETLSCGGCWVVSSLSVTYHASAPASPELRIPADGNVYYALDGRVDHNFLLRETAASKWLKVKPKEVNSHLLQSLLLVPLHILQDDKNLRFWMDVVERP